MPYVVLGVAALLLIAAVGVVLLRPTTTSTTPAVVSPTMVADPSASSAPSVPSSDPKQQLAALSESDGPAAEALVGQWVPQLSAKKVGLVADGQTYDAAAILADHQSLRSTYPGSLLVWSGDYTSFKGASFWVTLVASPSATPEAANAWCAGHGLDADHCYAKRLSHTSGYAGNTRMRNGSS